MHKLRFFALGGMVELALLAAPRLRASPANDDFTNRLVLGGLPAATTGSNVGATQEPGEPRHAGNGGGKSVWWTWTAPVTTAVQVST